MSLTFFYSETRFTVSKGIRQSLRRHSYYLRKRRRRGCLRKLTFGRYSAPSTQSYMYRMFFLFLLIFCFFFSSSFSILNIFSYSRLLLRPLLPLAPSPSFLSSSSLSLLPHLLFSELLPILQVSRSILSKISPPIERMLKDEGEFCFHCCPSRTKCPR